MAQPAAENPWFRRYAPAPDADHRVVCFPHAGGSASYYLPVARALAPHADVLAVQYPGRQDRYAETPLTRIGALADEVYENLLPWTDRPLTLFGHSMGALVAFEVARRFGDDPDGPVRLYVSGRRAPSTYREESHHKLDDAGLVEEIRSLGGTDTSALENPELMALALPALRADYEAVDTYSCPPDATVPCPVTALVGHMDARATLPEVQVWRQHTTAAFDLKTYPGGHFYLTDHFPEITALLAAHVTSQEASQL
ncbi:alpha/beta fold hydrolase [Streptomyces sp. J2-1]|nr:alpha/beta fold hydrolase [Streptomyces corallincola]